MNILALLQAGLGYFLITALSGRFLGDVIIYILDKISKRTDNKVDDDLVNMLRRAFNNEPYNGTEQSSREGGEPGPDQG